MGACVAMWVAAVAAAPAMSADATAMAPSKTRAEPGAVELAADVADVSPPVLDNPSWLLSPGAGAQVAVSPDSRAPARVVSVPRFDAPAPEDWATRVQGWIAPGALLLAAAILALITWQAARRRRRRRRFRMRY